MTITVIGLPGPQGSKRFVGHSKSGRGIMVESSAKVKPWREAVKWAALDAVREQTLRGGTFGIKGAVAVEMTFTLPKPKSAPKKRKTWPDKKPDIDKLCRSTADSLTTAGAFEDDARIIRLTAAKVFPGEGTDALDVPGCVIRITAVRP